MKAASPYRLLFLGPAKAIARHHLSCTRENQPVRVSSSPAHLRHPPRRGVQVAWRGARLRHGARYMMTASRRGTRDAHTPAEPRRLQLRDLGVPHPVAGVQESCTGHQDTQVATPPREPFFRPWARLGSCRCGGDARVERQGAALTHLLSATTQATLTPYGRPVCKCAISGQVADFSFFV